MTRCGCCGALLNPYRVSPAAHHLHTGMFICCPAKDRMAVVQPGIEQVCMTNSRGRLITSPLEYAFHPQTHHVPLQSSRLHSGQFIGLPPPGRTQTWFC